MFAVQHIAVCGAMQPFSESYAVSGRLRQAFLIVAGRRSRVRSLLAHCLPRASESGVRVRAPES